MISMLTLNLRYQNLYDGKNSFENRIGIIHHCLRQELPDLIGFQELNDGMLDTLRSTLPEYTFIGCGRSSSCRGEHNSIAFRTSHFLLYSADTFWLSDLPGIPGSRFPEQGTIPRICTWAVLEYLPQNLISGDMVLLFHRRPVWDF